MPDHVFAEFKIPFIYASSRKPPSPCNLFHSTRRPRGWKLSVNTPHWKQDITIGTDFEILQSPKHHIILFWSFQFVEFLIPFFIRCLLLSQSLQMLRFSFIHGTSSSPFPTPNEEYSYRHSQNSLTVAPNPPTSTGFFRQATSPRTEAAKSYMLAAIALAGKFLTRVVGES